MIATLCPQRPTADGVCSVLRLTKYPRLVHQICGVLMLAGALGGYHIVIFKDIYTLAGKDSRRQGEGKIISAGPGPVRYGRGYREGTAAPTVDSMVFKQCGWLGSIHARRLGDSRAYVCADLLAALPGGKDQGLVIPALSKAGGYCLRTAHRAR